MTQFPILSVIIFTPIVGALIALALPSRVAWGWSLFVALADLALTLALIPLAQTGAGGYQFVERMGWLPEVGVSYTLGVDGLSLFLLSLNALITLVALIASWPQARTGDRTRGYVALMLLLTGAMQGVFLATNVFLFYIFWELMLVPAYLLVGMFGGPRRAFAAIKFVLYTAIGSLVMLVGVIWLGVVVSSTAGAPFTLDLPTLLRLGVPPSAQGALFLAFMAAFAVKAGLFPLHSWAPDAYVEAPAPVAAVVAGVMAKTAIYGMLRLVAPLFPQAMHTYFPLIGTLAVIGILYFALQALISNDFKRLLAYVSLSHMSVIVLGVFALNAQGIQGAILQMVNHGIIIAALFLIAAAIESRVGVRRLDAFGALATRLPWLATAFLIASLAALGLPGLNSFAGEFLAFLGAFHVNWVYGALATLVVIPAAWYMLRFFQGVMEGAAPESGPVAAVLTRASGKLADLRWQEWLALMPLIALMFYLGVVPAAITTRTEAVTQQIVTATQTVAPAATGASHGS
ncbi:MAG TPA: NADH-quinone oxidoreductase subunit M [Ktedonobacterales bacterium]|jgi:NADH-quinone oxidoreductase subunit M|nr:NADH-quinone oxidoreductase subunit M [Ktedonobacterales bacterium]